MHVTLVPAAPCWLSATSPQIRAQVRESSQSQVGAGKPVQSFEPASDVRADPRASSGHLADSLRLPRGETRSWDDEGRFDITGHPAQHDTNEPQGRMRGEFWTMPYVTCPTCGEQGKSVEPDRRSMECRECGLSFQVSTAGPGESGRAAAPAAMEFTGPSASVEAQGIEVEGLDHPRGPCPPRPRWSSKSPNGTRPRLRPRGPRHPSAPSASGPAGPHGVQDHHIERQDV